MSWLPLLIFHDGAVLANESFNHPINNQFDLRYVILGVKVGFGPMIQQTVEDIR